MLGMNKNRMRLESISHSQQPVLADGGSNVKFEKKIVASSTDSPFLKQHKDVKTTPNATMDDWKI
jgi:hypothetical protein